MRYRYSQASIFIVLLFIFKSNLVIHSSMQQKLLVILIANDSNIYFAFHIKYPVIYLSHHLSSKNNGIPSIECIQSLKTLNCI